MTTLINALSAFLGNLALVLDDYYCITGRPIHDAVAFFLDHMPAQMHLIISSRMHPPFPLARLRSCNQLMELNARDMRFTREETTAFLLRTMELPLTEEAINVLEARTEGWVAGLQLAALSLREQENISSFLAAFTGNHRHILDYLSEEIFTRQPEVVQTFLLYVRLRYGKLHLYTPLAEYTPETGAVAAERDAQT
ncbi:MAG: hypothetical protein JO031_04340, partial [Ktedonobacteraceae bacterium]|nr:hypothetical protein [Ktedonobacteraceae bacterium]